MRGRTLFSTHPLLMNRQRNLGDPLCAECHRNGSSSAETALVMDPDDQRDQIYGAPLGNTADCRTCHTGGAEKLGMVPVRQNLGPIQRHVGTCSSRSCLPAFSPSGSLFSARGSC